MLRGTHVTLYAQLITKVDSQQLYQGRSGAQAGAGPLAPMP
jgi:hypothetical protein